MGASAFINDYSWAKEVGMALNLEGSGNRGPVVMFETSTQNGWLIQELEQGGPNLVATSLPYDVYRHMSPASKQRGKCAVERPSC